MTSLAAELSRIAWATPSPPKGWRAQFGQVQVSDRPDLAQFQCNGALAAAKAAKANPRAIAEKIAARLKADAALRQGRDRRSRLYQSRSHRCGAGRAAGRLARDARLARRRPARQDRGDRFRRPQYRQAHACRASALLHHRRLPAAALPRQWLAGDQRCPSGRLGPADGPADFRDRAARASRRSISTPLSTVRTRRFRR